MSHNHTIAFVLTILGAAFSLFVGFVWGKSKGHALEGSRFGIWLGGAMSAFIGGFLEATPIGSTSGAGLAAATGHVHADLTLKHLCIEVLFLISTPFLAGVAEIRTYIKTNPFPNVFLPDAPPSIAPSPPKAAMAPVIPSTDFHP